MSAPIHCPRCGPGPRLSLVDRPGSDQTFETFLVCPKCEWESFQGEEEGIVHVEPEFLLHVELPATAPLKSLRRLRQQYAPLKNEPLGQLVGRLRERPGLTLGPVSHLEMKRLQAVGQELGLPVNVELVETRQGYLRTPAFGEEDQ